MSDVMRSVGGVPILTKELADAGRLPPVLMITDEMFSRIGCADLSWIHEEVSFHARGRGKHSILEHITASDRVYTYVVRGDLSDGECFAKNCQRMVWPD